MAIAYELRLSAGSSSTIQKLDTLLRTLSNSGEIEILSTSSDGSSELRVEFHFGTWRDLAKRRYLEASNFRSAIPIEESDLKQIEKDVYLKLLEAAESELLASTLMVSVNADVGKTVFLALCRNPITRSRAQQVGIYLQQRLALLFGYLEENNKFPPIVFSERN